MCLESVGVLNGWLDIGVSRAIYENTISLCLRTVSKECKFLEKNHLVLIALELRLEYQGFPNSMMCWKHEI